ncbi:hypothetical protein BH09MYX1_BH09MYX1_57230 [soil metagenome]
MRITTVGAPDAVIFRRFRDDIAPDARRSPTRQDAARTARPKLGTTRRCFTTWETKKGHYDCALNAGKAPTITPLDR